MDDEVDVTDVTGRAGQPSDPRPDLATEVVRELLGARPHECVVCYVARMVARFGCDGTWRWVETWREQRAPRATRLERRLRGRGATCDCELHLRGYEPEPRMLVVAWEDPLGADRRCLGVRTGSSQPCSLWRPTRRTLWAEGPREVRSW